MLKAKGGRKKKVARPVVLSTLSDTDDPAPSPAPATAPADEVHLRSWRDSNRSLLLLLNLLPRDRRNNCDNSHMKKRTIWWSG